MADQENQPKDATPPVVEPTKSATPTEGVSKQSIEEVKGIAAVGYLGILFLLPLLMHPKNTFAVFHANQGLLLLITAVAINIIGGVIPFIGWFLIAPLGWIFCLVLFIMGLMNALNGQMKRLPLIGNFDILKVQK